MRPGMPAANFSTGPMTQGQERQLIAIGATEARGPLCCYQLQWLANSNNHQLTYLYTGTDRYQLWRHYYQALATAEGTNWEIGPECQRPTVGAVAQLAAG